MPSHMSLLIYEVLALLDCTGNEDNGTGECIKES